jgi:hypothetical protein
MNRTGTYFIFLMALCLCGCSHAIDTHITDVPFSNAYGEQALITPGIPDYGTNIPWGYYDLEIARDGSYAHIIPNRTVNWRWGIHLNAVKLLEQDPCTKCISTSNVHKLPNGDVSVDITITHPYKNPMYTGFDVRGIIMFPASQYIPDQELREKAGIGYLDTK